MPLMLCNNYLRYLLFVALLPASGLLAEVGNEGPHGGDYVASEFIIRGQAVLDAMQNSPANAVLLDPQKRSMLATAVNKTPVESVDHDLYDQFHRTVDAITKSDETSPTGKLIQLNRARWERLLRDQSNVHRLVFHEYLWVIDADDTNYVLSRRLQMAAVARPPVKPDKPFDLSVHLDIVDTAGTATYRFFATDGEGNKGRLTYTSATGTIDLYLNPRRSASIQTTAGSITVCYEAALANSISFASYGGTIHYCNL